MAEPESPKTPEPSRTKQLVGKALRPRLSLLLVALALAGAVVSLVKNVSPPAVGAALGFVALLILLAQIAGRSFLMQIEQSEMLEQTGEATEQLKVIRSNTEEELQAERKQNAQLELLLTAMKAFNLIEVDSLKALSNGWPTTAFYVQRHATTLLEILEGRWDRSEYLRPEQLWREYNELLSQMKEGEVFRSTVCLPAEPALLFEDEEFNDYVAAIYEAAKSRQVQVKRLFVLSDEDWLAREDALEANLREHLEEVAEVETDADALKARVTSEKIAKKHFHIGPPDFMMWGDSLLIESDLNSPNELVTRAVFDFASDRHSSDIRNRQKEFDEIFADGKKTRPLSDFI